MPRLTIGIIVGMTLAPVACAQSRLPPCPSAAPVTWTNCVGALTWPDGREYVGEFKGGKLNGHGAKTWADGERYVGEFKDDKQNGQGAYTWPDGGKYVGEFKDDKLNGHGAITAGDGRKYVGEFKDGKAAGQGATYAANGSILQSGAWLNNEFMGPVAARPPAPAPERINGAVEGLPHP